MEADFDEIIHVPTRLRICALLAGAGEVEFSVSVTVLLSAIRY